MILVMSEKYFQKYKKKLVEPKDYVICDATDDENGGLTKYTNVITMDGLVPPSKLIQLNKESDKNFDVFKLDKLEEKFFKGNTFISACMAVVAGIVQNGDINIFIVLHNKAFKYYSKEISKRINKIAGVDCVFRCVDFDNDRRYIRMSLNRHDITDMKDNLKALESRKNKSFKKKK